MSNENEKPIKDQSLLSEYSVKIKDVYIELEDYKYFHSPVPYDEKTIFERFIGRRKIIRHLKSLLRNTETLSGAYLVTGFRGMGKTSIVRKVIKELNLENNDNEHKLFSFLKRLKALYQRMPAGHWLRRILKRRWSTILQVEKFYQKSFGLIVFFHRLLIVFLFICLSLLLSTDYFESQAESARLKQFFDDSDNFFNVIKDGWIGLTSNYESFWLQLLLTIFLSWGILSLLILIIDVIWYTIRFMVKKSAPRFWYEPVIKSFEINLSQDEIDEKEVLRQIAVKLYNYWSTEIDCVIHRLDRNIHFLWRPFVWIFYRTLSFEKPTYTSIRQKLEHLNDRLLAEVINENQSSLKPMAASNRLGFSIAPFSFSRKNVLNYPIATAKEIESELIQVLSEINDLRKRVTRPVKLRKNRIEQISNVIPNKIHYLNVKISVPEHIPRFVFVIDELDKIEPRSSASIRAKESSDPYFDENSDGKVYYFSTTKVRQRQEAVGRLLANLKGFLNVAMAKFIFIGGREMYDAALADIADRDSFYSSIFHDIIYINSFFKDKLKFRSGVTKMTEAYLCSLIIPEYFLDEKLEKKRKAEGRDTSPRNTWRKLQSWQEEKEVFYNLGVYYEYLVFSRVSENEKKGLRITDQIQKARLYKVIYLLQNYIIYLTYRSNGSPKKLSNLIEDIITHVRQEDLENNNKYLVIPLDEKRQQQKKMNNEKAHSALCLRFNYNKQYEIGLTSNLYRPYLINNSRFNKSLGDKLLFSSAFIIDHLLKFHPFAFSWRNLELLPEVILVNKEPNLREYIEDIVRYLSKMHFRPAMSGIFQYKFFNKVKNELTLASKISELSAAAYHFTLDESLQIKRHYKRKLAELEGKYNIQNFDKFNHSIALVQTILGDLHFYDQEYDDALLYYTQSLESLRVRDSALKMTKHQFVIWVRNKLKIGLTLEKIRAFDSAYSYYRKLILEIPHFLGEVIDRELIGASSMKGTENIKHTEKFDTFVPIHPSASFEGLKPYRSLHILSMPFTALLALAEKHRTDGLNMSNLLKNEKELDQVYENGLKDYEEEPKNTFNTRLLFLKADYYNDLGGLLFYKNKPLAGALKEQEKSRFFPEFKTNEKSLDTYLFKPIGKNPDYRSSLVAYSYYKLSLVHLIRYHVGAINPTAGDLTLGVFWQCTDLLLPQNLHKLTASKMYYIANILSKLGDCILGSIAEENIHSADSNTMDILRKSVNFRGSIEGKSSFGYEDFVEYWKLQIGNLDLMNPSTSGKLLTINMIFSFYNIAAIFYLKASRTYSFAFQYKKTLFLISDLLTLQNKEQENSLYNSDGKQELMDLVERMAIKIIQANTWTTDIANRPQILKYRDIFQLERHDKRDRWSIYNNTTNAVEVREVIVLVEEIRLKLVRLQTEADRPTNPRDTPKLECSLLSPYTSIGSRHLRIFELRYRALMYYYIFNDRFDLGPMLLEKDEWLKFENQKEEDVKKKYRDLIEAIEISSEDDSVLKLYNQRKKANESESIKGPELIAFLIREALFCNLEIIRTQKLFGINYISSYTHLASAYEKTGKWCAAYENFELLYIGNDGKKGSFVRTVEKNLKELLGTEASYYLEPNYHFEQAIQNYYYGIQTHIEGRAYKNLIQNFYLLEDDFNDNLTHFCAAMERLRINTGTSRLRIRQLSKKRNRSKLYDIDSYRPEEFDADSLEPPTNSDDVVYSSYRQDSGTSDFSENPMNNPWIRIWSFFKRKSK